MKSPDETQSLKLALGVYSLVFAMKLIVYFMTGIMALFAEALHTLSDIFISGFLLMAAIYSQREPDKIHMFGYGRTQNVALVSATLFISFTSFELYREAIPRFFQPEEATYQNVPLAVGVIIVSMIIAAAPLIKLLGKARAARPLKLSSPS
jgi:cation diffusion facilitator family transporter